MRFILPMKLGTGVQVNILSDADYNHLENKPQIHSIKETSKGYYQGHITVKGKCIMTVKHWVENTGWYSLLSPDTHDFSVGQPVRGWNLSRWPLRCNSHQRRDYGTVCRRQVLLQV